MDAESGVSPTEGLDDGDHAGPCAGLVGGLGHHLAHGIEGEPGELAEETSVVSGVPRYNAGDLFLDEVTFEADHKLFEVFSPLIRSQLEPLLRVRAQPHLESYLGQLSAAVAVAVELESLQVDSIDLEAESAVLDAQFRVSVSP